jgi:membrane protein
MAAPQWLLRVVRLVLRGLGYPLGMAQKSQMSEKSWWAVLRRTATEFQEDELADQAAVLTLYGVLSLFPALLVLIALLGDTGESATRKIVDNIGSLTPGAAHTGIAEAVEEIQSGDGTGPLLAIVGLVVALCSASGYLAAFNRISRTVHYLPEGPPSWRITPLRLLVTIGLMSLACAGALIVVFSGGVAEQAGTALGVSDSALTVWSVAKWPVLVVLVVTMIALLYWASPKAKGGRFRLVTHGGALALTICTGASALFALYVADLGSYNRTFGTLASLIIFFLWFWVMNLAVLLGLEFDAVQVREQAAVLPASGR